MAKPVKTLTLLFLRRDDTVLLAMKKRGFGAGRWNGVGGKLDPEETITQALIRECQEEIGVTPTSYHKVARIRFDEYVNGEPTIMQVHAYVADAWEGEPTESEEMKPKWFHIDAVPYDEMWPDDPYWLPQVLAGETITADFTLDENDKIVAFNVRIKTDR